MSNIIEALGVTLAEAVGAALVFVALAATVIGFHFFGDTLIGYFM